MFIVFFSIFLILGMSSIALLKVEKCSLISYRMQFEVSRVQAM